MYIVTVLGTVVQSEFLKLNQDRTEHNFRSYVDEYGICPVEGKLLL